MRIQLPEILKLNGILNKNFKIKKEIEKFYVII